MAIYSIGTLSVVITLETHFSEDRFGTSYGAREFGKDFGNVVSFTLPSGYKDKRRQNQGPEIISKSFNINLIIFEFRDYINFFENQFMVSEIS